MNFKTFIKQIAKLEQAPLPASTSHSKLLPPTRQNQNTYSKAQLENAKQAAVMALIYPDNNQDANLVLILRKTYKGAHSAQIAFPGGKREPEDDSLKTTALRETYEEIGVPIAQMHVIKQLSKVYVPPSNFNVQPYLGYVTHTPQFIKQDSEVEALIEVKLEALLKNANLKNAQVQTSYNTQVEVPAFQLNGNIVWGATAMMLSEVKDIIKPLVSH